MTSQLPHRWQFFSAGGFDQVRLDTGSDLTHLAEFDQKLWVALSCPVKGLEFDTQTLALIDSDNDGHIRAPELMTAIRWASDRLVSPDILLAGDPLPLAAIAAQTEDGQRLLNSARHVLASLGKAEADRLAVDDTADSVRIFAGMPFNGDGVITAIPDDDTLQAALADIVAAFGGVPDRNGDLGIDQATVDRFFDEGSALVDWRQAPLTQADLQPLGAGTADGHLAYLAVRDKIDDFFTRCLLAAFDPRAGELLNGSEDDLRAIGSRNLATCPDDIAALPMAYVKQGADLPLTAGLNPAWSAPLAKLDDTVIRPLLGPRETLTAGDWADIKTRFAAYESWLASRPDTPLADSDPERLAQWVRDDTRARLTDLIARDAALAPEAEAIAEVDKLVRYARDLYRLANNFVAFSDFYTRRDKAIFQAGTLYLDGRSCDLCVKVLDPAKHAALASLSGVYLAYCDCQRNGEKMTIAAAFTAGDADQLMVGRNGVFYDRQGNDWDATIVKITDHPISIRQAFWSPYKKIVRLIAEQAQKFAAAKSKAADDAAAATVTQAGATKPATPPAPFDAAKFAGIFAAVGLAIGAIGTALASIVTGFLGLKAWQMPLALAGLMVLISGPAMAMAYFKLRNRNLGPILDANGWAVNTRARINIPFGAALTQTARLPEGSARTLGDPYAEKKTPWTFFVILGALLMGLLIYLTRSVGN